MGEALFDRRDYAKALTEYRSGRVIIRNLLANDQKNSALLETERWLKTAIATIEGTL